jgi:hypothetical protein
MTKKCLGFISGDFSQNHLVTLWKNCPKSILTVFLKNLLPNFYGGNFWNEQKTTQNKQFAQSGHPGFHAYVHPNYFFLVM